VDLLKKARFFQEELHYFVFVLNFFQNGPLKISDTKMENIVVLDRNI
jgi:hypothetical protein